MQFQRVKIMSIRLNPIDLQRRRRAAATARRRDVALSSAVTSEQVETELARTSLLRLTFGPAVEARYEADTLAARAWNIRLTVPMGLSAYLAFGFVDKAILPDLGWIPVLLRLGLITPAAFFAMWMCTRFSAAFRETFISYAITGTMMLPVLFMLASHAPLAPYTMLVVLLVSMFGNITMRLRFHWACFFSVMTILTTGMLLIVRSDFQVLLSIHLLIAMVTCVSFGIVANNQLERAERRSFLMALRESLRADQLGAEKTMFSILSNVDALTCVSNRRAFDARLDEMWLDWETSGQVCSVLMIDVDHFKRYNDTYGHQAGDTCLTKIAAALKEVIVRKTDFVARYGGEEFAVLLADCTTKNATVIAEHLRLAVQQTAIPHENRDDGETTVSVTIGAASMQPGGPTTAAEVVAKADRALYAAKRAGRNRVLADVRD